MGGLVKVRRALVSVSDKTDLAPFVRALVAHGVEIVSTGGTARALAEAGIPVVPIEKVTGFPEMMGGRVKTLHPMVHGGLLALRDDPEHAKAMAEHAIGAIDLLCVNLYPFEKTIASPGVDRHEAIEQIDIGGPSMIRSGAKNFEYVTVVPSPKFYDRVIADLAEHEGRTSPGLRAELAAAAFARTAEYDAAIAAYLSRHVVAGQAPTDAAGAGADGFPEFLRLAFTKKDDLRYGENPHQNASLYRDPASTEASIVSADVLHGKQLSYNNILDASAALELVKDLARSAPSRPGACCIKHTNACGAGVADSLEAAVDLALVGDPIAAFGGILAVNRPFDALAAKRATREGQFLEVIVAPSFDADALEMLRARWANARLLAVGERAPSGARRLDYRSVPGGLLVQDRDTLTATPGAWTHAAGPRPTPAMLDAAGTLWAVCKHLKSNAIVVGGMDPERGGPSGEGAGGGVRLFGAGAGQMDRLTSCRIAVEKAGEALRAALGTRAGGAKAVVPIIACSDAFFPFPDGPKVLLDAGATMLVHPGGSKRDKETLDLCEARGATCMLTGVRHFRH